MEHVFPQRQPEQEERGHRSQVAEGRALLEDLIRTADVLVENFRPGTLERLGLRPDAGAGAERAADLLLDLRLRHDRPRRDEPGYDMVIQGESGLMDVTGFPETGPTKVGVAITDCLAALYAVQGILLAHIQPAADRQGQFVDIALLDSAVSVLGLPAGIVAATGRVPAGSATRIRRWRRMSPIPRPMGMSSSQRHARVQDRFRGQAHAQGQRTRGEAVLRWSPSWRIATACS